jgi:class 3 adenylate cyclase/TolB-like protein
VVFYTDIVASTDLKQTLGDLAAQALIKAHHERVRHILGEFADAQEIETAGDSFLLVFADPADALAFALRLHASLRSQSRGQAAVRDRIGIHVGKVLVGDAGIFGVDIDTCARVMSVGGADQILLTRPAHDEAKKVLEGRDIAGVGSIAWRSHGRYHFKGLDEPLELFEVGEEGKARLRAPEDSEKAVRYRAGRVPVWPGPSGRRASRRLWVRAAYATAATLLLMLGAGLFFPERMSSLIDMVALREPQCIVVLPFRGLENDPERQALADGVSRTVVSRLTQLEATRWSLRVVPISEVFAEKVESLADARRLFGATLVLSGDASASGDTLRVNVTLSDARSRRQIKSTTLDLGPQSLLSVQDKVAKLAADWLGLTMSAGSCRHRDVREERDGIRGIPARPWLARAPGSQGASRDGRCGVPGIVAPGSGLRAGARGSMRSLSARVRARPPGRCEPARASPGELRRSGPARRQAARCENRAGGRGPAVRAP